MPSRWPGPGNSRGPTRCSGQDRSCSRIAERIADCLDEARELRDIPADSDTTAMANLLVDCWEGPPCTADLRRSPALLGSMLDFYFASVRG